MIPIIGVGFIALGAILWSSKASPEHRSKVLNELDKFSAAAGLMSRMFTAVDAFRHIVRWTETWDNHRVTSPPLTVPVPVQPQPMKDQHYTINNALPSTTVYGMYDDDDDYEQY